MSTTEVPVVAEMYRVSDWPSSAEAKRTRDKRARELRRQGLTVECKRWDFTDLARDVAYTLLAYKDVPPIVSPSYRIMIP